MDKSCLTFQPLNCLYVEKTGFIHLMKPDTSAELRLQETPRQYHNTLIASIIVIHPGAVAEITQTNDFCSEHA